MSDYNEFPDQFYSVTSYGYDLEGEMYAFGGADFYDLNIARIFAKRILGYPAVRVTVERYVHAPEKFESILLHDFRCVDKHYYDAGVPSLPDCEDSPIFASHCNDWLEV